MSETISPRGVSIETAAQQLSVSRVTINRLLAAKRLYAVKVGAKTLVTTESLEAFWESLPRAEFRAPKQSAAA